MKLSFIKRKPFIHHVRPPPASTSQRHATCYSPQLDCAFFIATLLFIRARSSSHRALLLPAQTRANLICWCVTIFLAIASFLSTCIYLFIALIWVSCNIALHERFHVAHTERAISIKGYQIRYFHIGCYAPLASFVRSITYLFKVFRMCTTTAAKIEEIRCATKSPTIQHGQAQKHVALQQQIQHCEMGVHCES